MQHTMRSAFKRWLILHNEEFRIGRWIRLPHWFRHYIRNTRKWEYTVTERNSYNYYCGEDETNHEQKRRYKGYYTFEISDDELLQLERPEWIK